MASSGTASFTISRNELINSSMRLLRVLREGDVANARQIEYGVQALQMLVKNMQSAGLALWTYQTIQIPMVENQTSYTLGPTGADVTTVRPLRLFDGTFIRVVNNGQNFDTQLRNLSRLEYEQFGSKGSLGVPNSIYYFPGIDVVSGATSPSTGYGTLYVYTTPSDDTRTIFGNFQRPLYDMTSPTDQFDFPQEWFQVLRYKLAAELGLEMQADLAIWREIRGIAKELQGEAQDWSVETTPIYFQPDQMMNWSGRR
jgi:hypothetical protein